jgi:phage terminase Nu1 subunit (DNA packaging protein)
MSERISTTELAEKLGVTDQWIRQLSDQGVLHPVETKKGRDRYFDIVEALLDYIEYQKEQIDNQTDKATKDKIAQADLRYKMAKAGKAELELEELQGVMHRAEDVETVVSDMIANIRSAILALPGMMAVDTAAAMTPAEASGIIKRNCDALLNDLARYRYDSDDYRKLVMEREKWINAKEKSEIAPAQLEKKKAPKKQPAKKAPQKKTPAKKTASKKQPASSRSSATASKRRKT